MTWLDSMVGDGELATQVQQLRTTSERPEPGVFEGVGRATAMGILRGGFKLYGSARSLVNEVGGTEVANSLAIGGTYFPDFEDGQTQRAEDFTQRNAAEIGDRTAQASISLTPDPQTTGAVGQILGEAADVLPRTVLGSLAGPVGAAVAAGGPAGYASKRVAMAQGVDEATATGKGLIEGLTVAAGTALPAARFLPGLVDDAAIAISANVGLGMVSRASTYELLSRNGYAAQAAQYQAFDRTAVLTDLVLGGAFFGIGRAGLRRPTTEQVDAALTERNAQHADIDTAPGAPINPRSAVAHQEAIQTAIGQLSRGEPVVLPESIHSAEFLRVADEPRPVAPSKGQALATARQELEPTVRAELEQEAAGILPNVADIKTELSAVGRSLEGLDDTFRARAKEFQQQGMQRKPAEAAAREAIDTERQQLSDRQASLTDALGGNRNAEQARADLAMLSRGEVPKRLQERATQRADAIVQGFERKTLAGAVAEGNKQSMAQIARAEIARVLDELERAEPTRQAKALDIGASKNVGKPETAGGKQTGKPAPAKASTPDKPGADVVSEPGKDSADADPVVQVADEILARSDDIRIATGATDADGNPITMSAREMLAQADSEIQAAQQDSQGFAAAAACFLQRGE